MGGKSPNTDVEENYSTCKKGGKSRAVKEDSNWPQEKQKSTAVAAKNPG